MATATIERTARLADVARAAGVSQGTVSNVFNRPKVVRAEVREHVRKVAEELGYRGPDPKGRLLRAGKVNAIGVATAQPLSYFFEDPFARVLMTGITEICDAEGVGISLVSAANEEELAWNLRSALVDGLVLFCLDGADRLIELARDRQLPFVALSLEHEDKTIPAVGIDNRAGARRAAEHLAALGHRRFAVLSLRVRPHGSGRVSIEEVERLTYSATRDRLAGYLEGLAGIGVTGEDLPIYETADGRQTVAAALEELFAAPHPPTAILAQSDSIALQAMDWFREQGIAVPKDVSIIGFDGIAEGAVSVPPLTTMAQPIAEIGRRAVRAILDGEGVHRERLDVELVVRGSTAPPVSGPDGASG